MERLHGALDVVISQVNIRVHFPLVSQVIVTLAESEEGSSLSEAKEGAAFTEAEERASLSKPEKRPTLAEAEEAAALVHGVIVDVDCRVGHVFRRQVSYGALLGLGGGQFVQLGSCGQTNGP